MLRALAHRILSRRSRLLLRQGARRLVWRGRERFCPVCESGCRRFLPDPRTGRADALCPVCGSVERHRSIWPFLVESTPLCQGPGLRVLHVAPEACLEARIRRLPGIDYVTADLQREDVMVRTDLAKLVFGDAEFDLLLCNHVLEHVPDDAAAVREMARVLRPGGCAIVTVPGPDPRHGFPEDLERTLEAPAGADPAERARRFGHPGHLRQYGRDLSERLAAAGFEVQLHEYGAGRPEAERRHLSVHAYQPIYLCSRPS